MKNTGVTVIFFPYLKVMIWQQWTSLVEWGGVGGWEFAYPHLQIIWAHHLRAFTPKFQKGGLRGGGEKRHGIQIHSIKTSWKLLFMIAVITFLHPHIAENSFPHTQNTSPPPTYIASSIWRQTYLSLLWEKTCVWRVDMQINLWQQHLSRNICQAELS